MPVGKIPTAHLEMRSASLTRRHASNPSNQLQSIMPYISLMIHRRRRSSSSWTHLGMATQVPRWRWRGTFPQETSKACLRMWRGRSCERLSLTRWRWIYSGLLHCGPRRRPLNSSATANLTAEVSICIFKMSHCLWLCIVLLIAMNSGPLAGFCVDFIIEIVVNNLLFMLWNSFLLL